MDTPENTPAKPEPTAIGPELAAMRKAFDTLQPLDDDAQRRIVRWLSERLEVERSRRHGYDEEPPF